MSTPTRTRAEVIALGADNIKAKDDAASHGWWASRDHDLDRRAILTWAENWPDWHAEFAAHGLTPDQADAQLYDAMRATTHPAARASLVFHVFALREAVEQLADLTAGLLDPFDVHPGPCLVLTRHEIAEALLRADIDQALQPLLTGVPA